MLLTVTNANVDVGNIVQVRVSFRNCRIQAEAKRVRKGLFIQEYFHG